MVWEVPVEFGEQRPALIGEAAGVDMDGRGCRGGAIGHAVTRPYAGASRIRFEGSSRPWDLSAAVAAPPSA